MVECDRWLEGFMVKGLVDGLVEGLCWLRVGWRDGLDKRVFWIV